MSTIQIEQVCAIKRESFYAVAHFARTWFYKSDVSEIKNSLAIDFIKEQNVGHGTLLYN